MTHGAIEAVIFDLDGVIVDSEIWWDDTRRAFAEDRGRSWTVDDRHAVMGSNSRQWSETMRERLKLDMTAPEIEYVIVEAMTSRYAGEGAPGISGAVDAVRRVAAERPVALASSSHRAVIDAALRATDLTDTFRAVVSSDEVAHGKPAPDVFLEAARRLGVDPARTLVVEDSLNGLRAAKAAGMTAVLVPNHSVPPAAGATDLADLVLDRLDELDVGAMRASGAIRASIATSPADAPPGATTERRPARAAPAVADTIHPVRRAIRVWISRLLSRLVCRAILRIALVGRDRLPGSPAIYCLNHLSWLDPFVVMAALPMQPRLMFFGPKEDDMSVGGRNRLMSWTGTTIPYRPGKNDLLEATRRVHAAIAAGHVVVIFGEGRIRPVEGEVGPVSEGAAYFALREDVPLIPVAIRGTSWLGFGRRVELRVGEPLVGASRPTREAVGVLTAECRRSLVALVSDARRVPRPGRFGRWLTELFNDWPEGSREAAEQAARDAAGEVKAIVAPT